MRFIVEEAVSRKILARDVDAMDPVVQTNLSGACSIEFRIPYMSPSVDGIQFKAQGQLIHVEEDVRLPNGSVFRSIIATGILEPTEVNEAGDLTIRATGFSNYPKDIPWLDNWNPFTIDPFHIYHKVWNHLQSFPNGNLDVKITPASSGTFLLPGFGFDGTEFIADFFAIFIRAIDFRDCGDELTKLSRDIPFDYVEKSVWNDTTGRIDKTIDLGYPRNGVKRTGLSFRFGENVNSGVPMPESEIEWTSDVIVRGWWPGKVYSSQFTNAEPNRFRKVILEEDAKINSRERSAVRAKRALTRRQVPSYWNEIVIDRHHPNGPLGSFNLGDEILVEGAMPWVGMVSAWHRVLGIRLEGDGATATLILRHEGAFNYDPLELLG